MVWGFSWSINRNQSFFPRCADIPLFFILVIDVRGERRKVDSTSSKLGIRVECESREYTKQTMYKSKLPLFQKSKLPFFQKHKRPFFQKPKRPFRRPLPLPPIQPGDRIVYKNTSLLSRFISEQGKILSRRVTGLTLKQQRLITTTIKQARILSLLPFIYNNKILKESSRLLLELLNLETKRKNSTQKEKIGLF
ncbi:hypothetical protein Cgig2_009740 [Carnegiea gigantea]|uniref:Small ribosomal subunit protein bS18c n=1 Tax=Carnegiea gigantea TaxID=171969 RepID=A0A9Q1GI99_9CARY|nr:hypothetical protein Cgig2_009740 [Carnegiea gigantea]